MEDRKNRSEDNKPKKPKGFATMSKERNAEIAAAGGKVAHLKGVVYKWSSEGARAAG